MFAHPMQEETDSPCGAVPKNGMMTNAADRLSRCVTHACPSAPSNTQHQSIESVDPQYGRCKQLGVGKSREVVTMLARGPTLLSTSGNRRGMMHDRIVFREGLHANGTTAAIVNERPVRNTVASVQRRFASTRQKTAVRIDIGA